MAPETPPARHDPALAYAGIGLTIVSIAFTEIVYHGLGVSATIGAGLFLLGLIPIAYAALTSGFRAGLVSTLLLAAYTPHFSSPHATIVRRDLSVLTGAAVVLAIGLAMTYAMARVKLREDRLRAVLEQRAHELEQKNRDLVASNTALEAFGYVVSHDLKEPVRALENYLDAARSDWPNDEGRQYLEEAYESNQRLINMMQGLLAYSRTSNFDVAVETLDPKEVIESDGCRAQYDPKLRERGATLIVQSLPHVLGDRTILTQLFGNVILNSIRHNTKPRPTVLVRAAGQRGGLAHIVVEDNGPGFPPDVLLRFQALEGSRPSTIKSGFGLAISQLAARRLGGQIWLANGATGGGAEVHVQLPAAEATEPARSKPVLADAPA